MSKQHSGAHRGSGGAPIGVQVLATHNRGGSGSKDHGLDLSDKGHGSDGHGDAMVCKNEVAVLLSRTMQVTICRGRVLSTMKTEVKVQCSNAVP
jgi:hypothetical protein